MKDKYLPIEIKEPYWGAWNRFGWAKNLWGVGLKEKEINHAIAEKKLLKVTIQKIKKAYIVDPKKVKKYSEKNKTQFVAKFDTILYVVPETILNGTDK